MSGAVGKPCINAGGGGSLIPEAHLQGKRERTASRKVTLRRRKRGPHRRPPCGAPNSLGSPDPGRPPQERGAPCRPPEERDAGSREAVNMAGRPKAPASQPPDPDGAAPNVVARVSKWADDHLRLVRVSQTGRAGGGAGSRGASLRETWRGQATGSGARRGRTGQRATLPGSRVRDGRLGRERGPAGLGAWGWPRWAGETISNYCQGSAGPRRYLRHQDAAQLGASPESSWGHSARRRRGGR